jgi:hypothetical protein
LWYILHHRARTFHAITSELRNVRELKEVGFTEKQAEKLAELFERSQSQGFEKFAEMMAAMEGRLDARFAAVEARMTAMEERLTLRLDGKIDSLRAELYKALHDQLLKMFALVVGVVSLAVAIIKLFPDWH